MDAAITASEKTVVEADCGGRVEPSMASLGSDADPAMGIPGVEAGSEAGSNPYVFARSDPSKLAAIRGAVAMESVVTVGKDADGMSSSGEVDEVAGSVAAADPDAIALEGAATAIAAEDEDDGGGVVLG